VAKVVLNTIGSRYGSIEALNANFAAIEEAFENTVSRDGEGPNALEAALDAGGFRIINLPAPVSNSDAVTKLYVDNKTAAFEGFLDEIEIVADNIDAIVELAPVAEELTGNVDAIVTVATSISDVNDVADNIGNVALIGQELNGAFQQGVVYDFGSITEATEGPAEENTSSIVIVGTNIDDVRTVGENIDDVIAVADSIAAVNDVADNETNINLVAAIDGDITAVAAIDDAVVAVNANSSNINSAVSNATNINAVASNATNINAAVANQTNINAVVSNATNINTVATNSSNVTTVAGSISNVNTVATNNTNVSTVATSIANVNTVANNIADVQNAEENADAAIAAKVAAEAARDAALAALDSFDDRYLGQKSTPPSVDNDGNALITGALYFRTSDNIMYVWDGAAWLAAYASLSGALLSSNNLSDLTNASSARTNLGLGALAVLASVGSTQITNGAVTAEKLAATLDFGSIA
jgi:hypothetical protein